MVTSVRGENIDLGMSSFTAMTFNLWERYLLEQRADVIRHLFLLRPPDLLGVQELRPESQQILDETLTGWDRVYDDMPSWSRCSNIWWRTAVFEYQGHGFELVDKPRPNDGLYWVRLKPLFTQAPDHMIFSTGHLTHQNQPEELADLTIRRVPEARHIIRALDEIAGDDPVIFTGDVNDVAPVYREFGRAGYLDTFTALGRSMPPTHPLGPVAGLRRGGVWSEEHPSAGVQKAFDVLFSRGPLTVRSSEVVEYYFEGRIPSDHAPVTATFTFNKGPRR